MSGWTRWSRTITVPDKQRAIWASIHRDVTDMALSVKSVCHQTGVPIAVLMSSLFPDARSLTTDLDASNFW